MGGGGVVLKTHPKKNTRPFLGPNLLTGDSSNFHKTLISEDGGDKNM